ncbi:MAG TPA: thiamine-phosphate kinase [Balneolales bacterium]|nr:thiamine-phosphate kinase [Balneolales bacterium]
MSEEKFSTIESIGRNGLIKEIENSGIFTRKEVLKGIGDDAAVIKESDYKASLLSTETYIEGVDFDLAYTPFHHLGYKIVTAAVSDIYAMNAHPTGIMIGLAIPNRISVEMIKELYKGINAACLDNKTQLIGGDITASRNVMALNVSVYGSGEIERIVYRSGARQDDAICVSGDLGGALAGLKILLREKKFWLDSGKKEFEPDLSNYEYVVKRQLVPIARRNLIDLFEEHDIIPSSMTDISQGLINDLKNITQASNAGVHLYEAAIPVSLDTRKVADEMQEDVDNYALHGGEDYEMLFTLPQEDVDKLSKVFKDFAVIGKVRTNEDGIVMQTASGDVWTFDANNDGK